MLCKWHFVIESVDLFLFQPVDLVDVGLHDPLQAGIVETVQTMIGNCRKAASDFMRSSGARIEATNIVCDGPLNRRIIAGVKVKRTDSPGTTPIPTV